MRHYYWLIPLAFMFTIDLSWNISLYYIPGTIVTLWLGLTLANALIKTPNGE